jgi:2-oxoglutarate dehydrogenase E2 component (dihydrolipoamide succinyltransferase)
MSQVEVLLPKMGESVAEATIIKWLKSEGDSIASDEALVEIATDKVDSEVPSPQEGILVKILCKDGDVIKVGQPIAIISNEKAGVAPEKKVVESTQLKNAVTNNGKLPDNSTTQKIEESISFPKSSDTAKFYSPLVKNIAKSEGIPINELDQISGTGADGRVTKNDILAYLPNRNKVEKLIATKLETTKTVETQFAAPAAVVENPVKQEIQSARVIKSPTILINSGDEILEMDRMRKLIAEHMVMSKHVSPHVTSYVEADVTNIVNWRNKVKDLVLKRDGEKITFTPIFIEAIVKALKEMPMVNVSTDGERIIKRKNINIGMATALPSGNLIVPVIKEADTLNLIGLTKKVNDLANRARNNQLKPEDIQGGTYTITNVGSFGNVMGTPIINQPQAAIMAVGAIRKKPAVIETPQGDFIGIRHMMFLSHAYDHRIIDGALGGTFVRKVADFLEQFDVNREI